MHKLKRKVLQIFLLSVLLFFTYSDSYSQGLLNRVISVKADHLRLENVLDRIGEKCGFYFSYNSDVIPRDSIVSIHVNNQPLKEILTRLLGDRFEYRETEGYVILRYAPHRLALITDKVQNNRRVYRIRGEVVDERTGERIARASVYERKLLRSALTGKDGSFELKIKASSSSIVLTASKEFYKDTTVIILSSVDVNPSNLVDDEYYYSSDTGGSVAVRTALGRFFISSKQKIQELNVPGFIAESPVQVSLTPGLSSHGMLSGQVINKFSLNVFGGYTAGVEGVEAGGWFNINKKYVKGAQTAGLFNMVGESVTGVQAGGLMNGVLGSVNGAQVGGLANFVKGAVAGIQVGGLLNSTLDTVSGIQIGGLANLSAKDIVGLQVAGLLNISLKSMKGMQVAGLVNVSGEELRGMQVSLLNIARRQNGFQFGLINLADTASGVSFGLLNLVRKNGIHSISVASNEMGYRNLELRTGTAKLYTILQAGYDYFGAGLGKRINLHRRFYLSPELIGTYIYQGSWDYDNSLIRINTNFSFRLNKLLSVFAGPSFNVFHSDQFTSINGHELVMDKVNEFKIGKGRNLHGWVGWNAGISIF